MKLAKKTAAHKIFKRNDGRYAVKTRKAKAAKAEAAVGSKSAEEEKTDAGK
ncbi:MAG: hypothetical protein GDA55_00325 [Cellvibrionales bacterium]|nr:hypothetical protein [Cellvibrionales bacterium]